MQWDKLYESMQSADTAEQLFELIQQFARQLGFEHISYVMQVPSLNGTVKWLRYEDMPEGWAENYAKQKYAEIDPLVRWAIKSIEPVVWGETIFADTPQIWADANRFGLKHGISQSCWAAQGVFGMLTLLRSKPALSPGEISMLRRQLQLATNLLHLAMFERVDIPGISRIAEVNLTAREREILRWTSEGKTAEIVGAILNISTRTVNFHISNVLNKLVAVNKVQAVAKARTFGLL